MVPIPGLKTGALGGVSNASADELLAMRDSDYILRACNGELTRVQVEKHPLPHDPEANPQAVSRSRPVRAGERQLFQEAPCS